MKIGDDVTGERCGEEQGEQAITLVDLTRLPTERMTTWPDSWSPGRFQAWAEVFRGLLGRMVDYAQTRLDAGERREMMRKLDVREEDFADPVFELEGFAMLDEYIVFDWRDEFGQTMIDVGYVQRGSLPDREKRCMEALWESELRVYAVEAPSPGPGVVLRRLSDDREETLDAVVDGNLPRVGDVVIARLCDVDGLQIAPRAYVVDVSTATRLVSEIEATRRERGKDEASAFTIVSAVMAALRRRREPGGNPDSMVRFAGDRLSRDVILRLHAAFSELQALAGDGEVDDGGDVAGVLEGVDEAGRLFRFEGGGGDDARLLVFGGEEERTAFARFFHLGERESIDEVAYLQLTRLPVDVAHPDDLDALEAIGLRPTLHGVVEPAKFGANLRHEDVGEVDVDALLTSCRAACRALRARSRRWAA